MKEIRFDPETMMLVSDVEICYGVMCEPGHDCHREDHHLPQEIPVFSMEVENFERKGEKYLLLFPLKAKFTEDLLSGVVSHEMRQALVQFTQENPPEKPLTGDE